MLSFASLVCNSVSFPLSMSNKLFCGMTADTENQIQFVMQLCGQRKFNMQYVLLKFYAYEKHLMLVTSTKSNLTKSNFCISIFVILF